MGQGSLNLNVVRGYPICLRAVYRSSVIDHRCQLQALVIRFRTPHDTLLYPIHHAGNPVQAQEP